MNDNNILIKLKNGLGDRLLDLIGFYIICRYLNYKPYVNFNSHYIKWDWGSSYYSEELFNFNEIIITDKNYQDYYYFIKPPIQGISLSPYNVYLFIKYFIPNLSFGELSHNYVKYAKQIIKPSEIIKSNIPKNIENAYGIHLRKSDRVDNTNKNNFNIIINKLLEDVENIIINEKECIFLIVSEDNNWLLEIKNKIIKISKKYSKLINFIDIDYTNHNNYANFNSVLDMFCLSKCKEILQGIHYSSFSTVASILGNCKIRNYSHYINNKKESQTYYYNSVININNVKEFNISVYQKLINHNLVLNYIYRLKTNIKNKNLIYYIYYRLIPIYPILLLIIYIIYILSLKIKINIIYILLILLIFIVLTLIKYNKFIEYVKDYF